MELATLGALAGQYAMGKIEANSANAAAKKANKTSYLANLWAQDYMFNKQKEWEKERATHAHQWEMQDLKAAGLNPALTAMGGQGASTGGISSGGAMSTPAATQGLKLGNMLDFMKNNRENRLADYQEMIAKANSAKAIQETANLAEENPYISKKMKSEIAKNQGESANALAQAGKAAMETDTGWKIQDYKVSQEFGKAAQELYQGRLSDVKADFLNKYGISADAVKELGTDGLKVLGMAAAAGIGKKGLSMIGKTILKKTSAKALDFSNFPR